MKDRQKKIIERILEVVNQPTQEEIDRLWAEEAERRIDELDSGEVEEIPGEQVFAEIRARLGK
ncbi:MAG: addiction module protein [Candidatus Omnitrophica bacterium]|nr:addiction module protein [Candidatus Omnitrophota bacterium]MCA9441667.1 addiction module protein [Candidatus Omnitrophota bacterium]